MDYPRQIYRGQDVYSLVPIRSPRTDYLGIPGPQTQPKNKKNKKLEALTMIGVCRQSDSRDVTQTFDTISGKTAYLSE